MSEAVPPAIPIQPVAVDPTSPPVPEAPLPGASKTTGLAQRLARGVVLVLLAILCVFVGLQGKSLLKECLDLRGELTDVRASKIVGYPGIAPQFSYARMPENWMHDEGESTLLWGGWNGVGHIWFRVDRGDVDPGRIPSPMGRDVIRAIDVPMVEQGGGRYWSLIPDDAQVIGIRTGAVETAYPVLILDKVLVVNDQVGEQAVLVLTSPYETRSEARIHVYNPVLNGRRLNMGLSGYFHDQKPVLYDRGTESLWVTEDAGLVAIAGPSKGQHLDRVAQPLAISWGSWCSQHPTSRLVVGADRSGRIPAG